MVQRDKMFRVFVFIVAVIFITGCAIQPYYISDKLKSEGKVHRILLMPTDIELSVLHAGGITEPHAEWTAKSEKLIKTSLRKLLEKRKSELIDTKFRLGDTGVPKKIIQLVKLHSAVGLSIIIHKYFPIATRPALA